MLGMLNSAADMVQKGMEKVAEVGAGVTSAGLLAAADVLDKAIAAVEDPMADVGKDVVTSKKEAVSKVFSNHIVSAAVDKAEEKCKGPSNAITDYLINKASGHIVSQLLTEVDAALTDHKGIVAWGKAIEQYNKAVEKIASFKLPTKVELKPIELNIKQYICEKTVESLATMMAEEEAKNRAEPEGKASNHPSVFIKVFKGEKLTYGDYKTVGGLPQM